MDIREALIKEMEVRLKGVKIEDWIWENLPFYFRGYITLIDVENIAMSFGIAILKLEGIEMSGCGLFETLISKNDLTSISLKYGWKTASVIKLLNEHFVPNELFPIETRGGGYLATLIKKREEKSKEREEKSKREWSKKLKKSKMESEAANKLAEKSKIPNQKIKVIHCSYLLSSAMTVEKIIQNPNNDIEMFFIRWFENKWKCQDHLRVIRIKSKSRFHHGGWYIKLMNRLYLVDDLRHNFSNNQELIECIENFIGKNKRLGVELFFSHLEAILELMWVKHNDFFNEGINFKGLEVKQIN